MCFSSFFAPQNCQNDTLTSSNTKYMSINDVYSDINYNSLKQTSTLFHEPRQVWLCDWMRSDPTLISSMFAHEILISTTVSRTTSLRFPKRCHIFLGVRNIFVWKRTFLNSPTPSRKRAEAAEEKRKILQCSFRSRRIYPFILTQPTSF